MVKNLPTVERSTKIRFGKNCTDDQAENTIVFNASDEQLDIPFSDSVYMTPLRLRTDLSDRKITVLAYNQVTKEVMDSGAVAEDILNFSLEAAVINGNVTGNTVSFNDAVTSVTTVSNVGVANGNPVHTLDVGSTFNVDTEGSNLLTVLGNTYMQNNLVVDGNMRVNGALTTVNTVNTIVKDPIIELGKENVSSDLGIIMYRPNANVAVGFREGPDELVFAYTDSSSYGSTINPKTSDSLDVRVYGRVLTESNVGILTTTPTHSLDVGSNLFVDEFGSNVLYVTGNTHTTDILSIGNKVGIKETDPDAELHVEGNVYVSSNLTVDEDTFHVDATTHSIGIETKEPDANLHVVGNVYVSSNLTVDEDTLHVDSTAHAVGIETKSPDANLHVVGNVYVSDDLTVDEDTFHVDSTVHSVGIETKEPDANLHVVGNVYVSSNLTVDENTFHVDATAHAVGIETKNPDANLHVVGNVYTSGDLTVDENTFHVDAVNHAVGIETKAPDAKLHVIGNVYVSSDLTVDENTFHVDAAHHSVGIETKSPDANLHVAGNVYVSSNLTVDTNTLHVDAETGRVGLGTKAPAYLLDVHGTSNVGALTAVSGRVATDLIVDQHIGINTLTPSTELHIEGNAYVSSNIQALTYFGDGGLLSNVTLQVVSDHGNTTSNTSQFTNPTTALTTDLTSNVEVKLDQLSNVSITDLAADQILVYDDSGKWVNEFPLHNYIKIRNAENGITMLAGNTVYIDSFHNANVVNAKLAKADSPTTMPSIGIVYDASLAPGTEGVAVAYGKVNQMNTLAFNEGETLYVSNTYAGVLSNVKPYGTDPDLIQNIGVVTRKHENSGAIFVTGVGRANDIPNAPIVADETDINYVYVNNENNDLKKILPTNLLTQLQTFEQVSAAGNTVSNTMEFNNVTTGLVTVANVKVGSNISVVGLIDATNKHVPMVGLDGFLEKSPIYFTPGGTYVVSAAEAEFLGNLTLSGNTTILNSESVTISDRIFGVASNNSASGLDSGFMIEHQEGNPLEYANVALIYHADEHRFSFSYTQNTFTDDHILHYEDETHRMLIDLIGNVQVRHNLDVLETLDVTGTTSLADDLTVGAASNLFVDVSTSRVGINEASPSTSLDVGGDVNIQSVVSATSKTTGALVVAGGVGVGGDVYASSTVLSGDLTVDTDTLIVNSTTDRVGINKAAPAVALDVVGDVHVTDNLNVDSGTLRVDSVTDRVSIGAAALDAKLQVGGNVHVESTTEAFSTATGAATIAGGLGVIGNVHATQYHGDGSKLTGLVTTLEDVANNGNTMSNVIIFENETTGLVTDGRIGVSTRAPDANLHVVGNVHVADTTEAFSTVTGAMTITGGLGVVGNVHAAQYHGDGSKLTGLVTALEDVANNGNTMSNVIIFENETTGLVTDGKVGVSTRSPDANLHVVGNAYVSDIVTLASGLVTNRDQVVKKTYAYSGTITAGDQPFINVNFTSNILYSKISAQLVDGNEELSTAILEVSGGSKNGVTPTKNISLGTMNIFGDVDNPNPWNEDVITTGNRVALRPLGTLVNTGEYHLFIEYTSPTTDGGVTTVDEDTTSVITFGY